MRKFLFLLLFLALPSVLLGQTACDLNGDGSVNIVDYQLLVNMALGKIPCTANINGAGVCDVVTAQRIIRAALDKGCTVDTPAPHAVTLNWTHSVTPSVTNYKVYRGSVSGGPYTLIATLDYVNTWEDTNVSSGATYYYVVTALDGVGNESVYSNEAQSTIPSP